MQTLGKIRLVVTVTFEVIGLLKIGRSGYRWDGWILLREKGMIKIL
jgi:hypothetical protein